MSKKTEKNARIFSDAEKNQVFEMYKNGDQLPKIADYLKVMFTSSEHKINEKTGKETGTAAYVTINGKKYGLKQLLFYLDKDKAAIEYETSNYQKGGRLVVDKIAAAAARFTETLKDLTGIKFNDYPDNFNKYYDICFEQAKKMDEKARKDAEERKAKEKKERKAKKDDKKFESYSIEEMEEIIARKKAALQAK